MSQIEVAAKELGFGNYHLYLVYTNDAGEKYVINAGPNINSEGLLLNVQVGVPYEDFLAVSDSADAGEPTLLPVFDAAADNLWGVLVQYAQIIKDAQFVYDPTSNIFGHNSNSVIASILDTVGYELINYAPAAIDVNPFSTPGVSDIVDIDAVLSGSSGDDRLFGGTEEDVLLGASGNDFLDGGSEADDLYGNDGDDTLNGGAGNDTLIGGAGTDTFEFTGDFGHDTVLGGEKIVIDDIEIDGSEENLTFNEYNGGLLISKGLDNSVFIGDWVEDGAYGITPQEEEDEGLLMLALMRNNEPRIATHSA